MQYLAERVASVTKLADPKRPDIAFLDSVPRGDAGRKRGPARTMMYDIAKGLARRVPLTKLVALDGDVRPYLASLMVSALHKAGDELVVPEDMKFRRVTLQQFQNMLDSDAGKAYDNYGMISRQLGGGDPAPDPARVQMDRMQDQLASVMDAVRTLVQNQSASRFTPASQPAHPGLGWSGDTEGTSMHVDQMAAQGSHVAAAVVGMARVVEANVQTAFEPTPDEDAAPAGPHPGSLAIRAARRPAPRKVLQDVSPSNKQLT